MKTKVAGIEYEVTSAEGVTGFIIRSLVENRFLFRVYNEDKTSFTDYNIGHYDLEVTIKSDAAFYKATSVEKTPLLDYDPITLGLKTYE